MSILGVAGRTGLQSHLTIAFPFKSPDDAQAIADELPPLMPDLAKVADTLGTVHYSRFVILSEKTLLFLADFDSEVEPLRQALATP